MTKKAAPVSRSYMLRIYIPSYSGGDVVSMSVDTMERALQLKNQFKRIDYEHVFTAENCAWEICISSGKDSWIAISYNRLYVDLIQRMFSAPLDTEAAPIAEEKAAPIAEEKAAPIAEEKAAPIAEEKSMETVCVDEIIAEEKAAPVSLSEQISILNRIMDDIDSLKEKLGLGNWRHLKRANFELSCILEAKLYEKANIEESTDDESGFYDEMNYNYHRDVLSTGRR